MVLSRTLKKAYGAAWLAATGTLTRFAKKGGDRLADKGLSYVLDRAAKSAQKRSVTRSKKHGTQMRKRSLKRKRKASRSTKQIKRVKKDLEQIIKKTVTVKANNSTYRKIQYGNLFNIVPTSNVLFVDHWRKSDNTSPYPAYITAFNYFNVRKYMDAAAILYNGKTRSIDWATTLDNFPEKDSKLAFLYASVNVKLVNHTHMTYEVIIHEFTALQNDDETPLDNLQPSVSGRSWIGGAPTVSFGNNCYNIEGAFQMNDIKINGYSHKAIKHASFMPGQEIDWFHSKSNFEIVPKKFYGNQGLAEVPLVTKGAIWLVVELRVKPYFSSGTDGGGAAKSIYLPFQPNNNDTYGIGVSVKELYKMSQPGETDDQYEGNHVAIYTDTDDRGMNPNAIRQVRTMPENYYFETDKLA